MPAADDSGQSLKKGCAARSFRLIPLLLLLATIGYIGARLFESRANQFGINISYAGGIPVAVGGIYFFTFLSIAASLAVSRIRKFPLFTTFTIGLVSGLAFYECTYAVIFAVFARNLGLLIPEASLPASGWSGYGTWFMLELLVICLSYPIWKMLRLTRGVLLLIMLYLATMVAWMLIYNFQYPPFINSVGVYSVNTIAEVAGTLILPVSYRNPEGNGASDHFQTMSA